MVSLRRVIVKSLRLSIFKLRAKWSHILPENDSRIELEPSIGFQKTGTTCIRSSGFHRQTPPLGNNDASCQHIRTPSNHSTLSDSSTVSNDKICQIYAPEQLC
jgi:hypothetical protein